MGVLTHQRESELVGLCLGDESRAGIEQFSHRGCRFSRCCAVFALVGIAAAGDVASDVENVLHGQGQAG